MKTRLQDKTQTIYQIAEEFQFANPSFFTQYFKKHTGMSPKAYRHSHGGKEREKKLEEVRGS